MKIPALEKELPGEEDGPFQALVREEAARAWELHQEGIMRELSFRQDWPEAVLILERPGVDQAQHVLATLPCVEAGLIDFDLVPLVAYPGFAR